MTRTVTRYAYLRAAGLLSGYIALVILDGALLTLERREAQLAELCAAVPDDDDEPDELDGDDFDDSFEDLADVAAFDATDVLEAHGYSSAAA